MSPVVGGARRVDFRWLQAFIYLLSLLQRSMNVTYMENTAVTKAHAYIRNNEVFVFGINKVTEVCGVFWSRHSHRILLVINWIPTYQKIKCLIKGSDDGLYHADSLGVWTLSIVRYSKTRKYNISETGSDFILRQRMKASTLLGLLERNKLNHCLQWIPSFICIHKPKVV
jgi:hypothetical protein